MSGCITALVTPFKNNEIDFDGFKSLLDYQTSMGVDSFVVNGTTAEASTMTLEEKRACVEFVINYLPDACICVGVSSNCTKKLTEEIMNVDDLIFDSYLITAPYYNKTSQAGLVAHINQAILASNKDIILYNIPGRCGMGFELDTVKTLAKHDQIVGIKEASGDLSYTQSLIIVLGDEIDLYCGNDDLAYIYYTLGAKGVISAVGNIFGDVMNKIYEGDYKAYTSSYQLCCDLFLDINPILIKGVLAKMGIIDEELRLPLVNGDAEIIDDIYKRVIR